MISSTQRLQDALTPPIGIRQGARCHLTSPSEVCAKSSAIICYWPVRSSACLLCCGKFQRAIMPQKQSRCFMPGRYTVTSPARKTLRVAAPLWVQIQKNPRAHFLPTAWPYLWQPGESTCWVFCPSLWPTACCIAQNNDEACTPTLLDIANIYQHLTYWRSLLCIMSIIFLVTQLHFYVNWKRRRHAFSWKEEAPKAQLPPT